MISQKRVLLLKWNFHIYLSLYTFIYVGLTKSCSSKGMPFLQVVNRLNCIKADQKIIKERRWIRQACMLRFWKGQEHQDIFSLVKGTLWENCKFLLEHFKGTKAMTRVMEAIAFDAYMRNQVCAGGCKACEDRQVLYCQPLYYLDNQIKIILDILVPIDYFLTWWDRP